MLRYISNNRFYNIFLFPIIIGSLSVASFEPLSFTFVNFFTLPMFFLILLNIKKKSKSKYRKKPYKFNLFSAGLFFGFGFFLTGNFWISNSLSFDKDLTFLIPFSIILIPLFLGLFYAIGALISGLFIRENLSSILYFSSIISIIDYLRGVIFTGFPWNSWAYSWSWFEEYLQFLRISGFNIFNLICITLFCLPVIVFFNNKTKTKISILSLGIFIFFSLFIYGNYSINKGKRDFLENDINSSMLFKIVSPGFEIKYGLSEKEIINNLEKIIKYSDPDKDIETVFVWPEGVFSGYYFNELKGFKDIIKKNFSKKHVIIFGANTFDSVTGKTYNSLIAINNDFTKLFHYNKIKLVPFGEFLPAYNFLEKIGLKKVTEGYGSFSPGDKKDLFNYKDYSIIPVICYEIIFPEYFYSYKNSNLILNISEDAWFGKSIGPHQHFAKAKFRAIENDNYLIRSANKGFSAFLDNKGKIIKILNPNEVGNIEFKVPITQGNKNTRNNLIFFILLFTYTTIFLYFNNEK